MNSARVAAALRELAAAIEEDAADDGIIIVDTDPSTGRLGKRAGAISGRDLGKSARIVDTAMSDWPRCESVYFVAWDEAFVKIGWSRDLRTRMVAYQTNSPREIRLHAMCPGTRKTEADYHQKFRKLHHRGEWFRYEQPIADEVALLRERFKGHDEFDAAFQAVAQMQERP